MKNVDLSNVTKIGNRAFIACGSLEEVDLSNTKEFGLYAFTQCYALKKVVFGSIWSMNKTFNDSVKFYDDITCTNALDPYYCDNTTFTGTDGKLVKTCTITLHCPDGEQTAEYQCGADLAKPEDPEPGEKFLYWMKDGSEFDFDGATMPGRNIDVYAVMEIAVTYRDCDGSTYYSAEERSWIPIRLPDEGGQVKESGQTLVGWRIDGGGDEVYGVGGTCTVQSNTDFIAVWEGSDVVVYVSNGGVLQGDPYELLVDGKAKINTEMESMFVGEDYYASLSFL